MSDPTTETWPPDPTNHRRRSPMPEPRQESLLFPIILFVLAVCGLVGIVAILRSGRL